MSCGDLTSPTLLTKHFIKSSKWFSFILFKRNQHSVKWSRSSPIIQQIHAANPDSNEVILVLLLSLVVLSSRRLAKIAKNRWKKEQKFKVKI